ncbi:unnamed protein product [Merluccius merluccius]
MVADFLFPPETSLGGVETPPRGGRGNLAQIWHSRECSKATTDSCWSPRTGQGGPGSQGCTGFWREFHGACPGGKICSHSWRATYGIRAQNACSFGYGHS